MHATEFEAVYPLDSLGYTSVQIKGRECMFSQPDSLGTVCEKVHGPSADCLARTQVVECRPELKSRKSILVYLFSLSRFSTVVWRASSVNLLTWHAN